MADQVFSHNDHNNAGGADVLLGARVDEAVLGHIHRLAAEVGGHVCHQQGVSHLWGTLKLHACGPSHQSSAKLLSYEGCHMVLFTDHLLEHRNLTWDKSYKGPDHVLLQASRQA